MRLPLAVLLLTFVIIMLMSPSNAKKKDKKAKQDKKENINVGVGADGQADLEETLHQIGMSTYPLRPVAEQIENNPALNLNTGRLKCSVCHLFIDQISKRLDQLGRKVKSLDVDHVVETICDSEGAYSLPWKDVYWRLYKGDDGYGIIEPHHKDIGHDLELGQKRLIKEYCQSLQGHEAAVMEKFEHAGQNFKDMGVLNEIDDMLCNKLTDACSPWVPPEKTKKKKKGGKKSK
eukprot:GFYU01016081.1.p1 GENE.GFYU01016081.1~~GFYU01016081.1.p1  ORF type:complete len:233 (+),score=44.45 GFYU01016081.1:230-928(+)